MKTKTEPLPCNAIAHTQWNRRIFYVSKLPGDGGADWGFTNKAEGTRMLVIGRTQNEDTWQQLDQAKALTPYWQRRFAKRCFDMGDPCVFIPVNT